MINIKINIVMSFLICMLSQLCFGESYRIKGNRFLVVGNRWDYQLHYTKYEGVGSVNWWGTATTEVTGTETIEDYDTFVIQQTHDILSVGTSIETYWWFLSSGYIMEARWMNKDYIDTVNNGDPLEVVPIGINSSDNNRLVGHGTYNGQVRNTPYTYTGYQDNYLTFEREETITVPNGTYDCVVFTTYNEWYEDSGWWGYDQSTVWVTDKGIIKEEVYNWEWDAEGEEVLETEYAIELTSMNVELIPPDNDTTKGISPIERLGKWNRSTKQWEAVLTNSITSGNVHVLTHGWGKGQDEWVAQQSGLAKVWNSDTGYFDAFQSVVDAIDQSYDPSANVHIIAYSWIDQSATNSAFLWDNQSAESAKYRDVAGVNLALALSMAGIDSSFKAAGGKLHLLGHSHGARVNTVAAVALESSGINVEHLTIWDSPERSLIDAWYHSAYNYLDQWLEKLEIGVLSGETFVDNYWSIFGIPYKNANIVNINMRAGHMEFQTLSAKHSYPVSWYEWATENNDDQWQEALWWSPLLGEVYQSLYLEYTRILFGASASIKHLRPTLQILLGQFRYKVLDLINLLTEGTVIEIPNGVRLIENSPASREWVFVIAENDAAIQFEYQFLNAGDGDELAIWIDGERRFIITGAEVGTGQQSSIFDISDLDPNEKQHFLTARLHG